MNVNPSSIARYRTASRLQLPKSLGRAPRKTTEYCTPNVGPLHVTQNVNRAGTTTSNSPSAAPRVQNSKIPERQTISLPHPAATSAKPTLPPSACLNPQLASFSAPSPRADPARGELAQTPVCENVMLSCHSIRPSAQNPEGELCAVTRCGCESYALPEARQSEAVKL